LGLRLVILLLTKHGSNLADLGLHSGCDNDTTAPTSRHFTSREGEVGAVSGGKVVVVEYLGGCLLDRERFTCQEGFVGEGVDTINEAEIGRDNASNTKLDNVARHKVDCFDLLIWDAISSDGCLWGSEFLERLNGLFGTVVLPETNKDVEEDNCRDHATLDEIANGKAYGHDDDEDERETVGNLPHENFPHGKPFSSLDLVRAIELKAGCRLDSGESIATDVSGLEMSESMRASAYSMFTRRASAAWVKVRVCGA
jgi:hypothetical protein